MCHENGEPSNPRLKSWNSLHKAAGPPLKVDIFGGLFGSTMGIVNKE